MTELPLTAHPLTAHPRALLFDLDGTLVDSFAGIAATIDAVFEQYRLPPVDRLRLRDLVGAPLEHIMATLLAEAAQATPQRTLPSVETCTRMYLSRYLELGVPASPLFPGMSDLIRACLASGFRLALVTSKRTPVARAVVQATGIEYAFEVIIGADVTEQHKPHAAPALAALQRLAIPAIAGTVVGDASYDVQMGRAAGCRTVGVTWGNGTAAALRAAGAHAIVDTPEALAATLLLSKSAADRKLDGA